jgi:hypothetical protein
LKKTEVFEFQCRQSKGISYREQFLEEARVV